MQFELIHIDEAALFVLVQALDMDNGRPDNQNNQQNKNACIIGLSGNLGAGKTTLTQAVARTLGIDEHITSPTFVIMKSYPIQQTEIAFTDGKHNIPWKKLIHIDAYRLDSGEELNKLGFQELAADPTNLILIEWPEKVRDCIAFDQTFVLENISENTRSIQNTN